jgi:S1-C subfamily serine protease
MQFSTRITRLAALGLVLLLAVAAPLAVDGGQRGQKPFAYDFTDLGLILNTQGRALQVDGVAQASLAAVSGLVKGDVILAAEGERISTGNELNRILAEIPFGGEVALTVSRRGQVGVVFVPLP